MMSNWLVLFISGLFLGFARFEAGRSSLIGWFLWRFPRLTRYFPDGIGFWARFFLLLCVVAASVTTGRHPPTIRGRKTTNEIPKKKIIKKKGKREVRRVNHGHYPFIRPLVRPWTWTSGGHSRFSNKKTKKQKKKRKQNYKEISPGPLHPAYSFDVLQSWKREAWTEVWTRFRRVLLFCLFFFYWIASCRNGISRNGSNKDSRAIDQTLCWLKIFFFEKKEENQSGKGFFPLHRALDPERQKEKESETGAVQREQRRRNNLRR